MNDMCTLKILVLHLLRERALITGCRVDRSSQLNVNALTVQRGTKVPNQLQDATAVTLEIRTLDALTISNDAASDLDLDLAIAFLTRVMGAGGERAEKLRRMFSWHTTSRAPATRSRQSRDRTRIYDGLGRRLPTDEEVIVARKMLAGGESEPDVDVIDVCGQEDDGWICGLPRGHAGGCEQ